MSFDKNIINNSALANLTRQAGATITNAIQKASTATGVNFAYLVEQAKAESSFDSCAQSSSSSACGLYQFIESTWLNMVEKHGDKYGLGELAAQISDGRTKSDPALKEEILALREDPEIASLFAAEFAADNQSYLESQGIEDVGSVELYLAHFMGAGGAAAFLKAQENNPLATAADLFPKAANANRNVFYDSKTGEARTLAGVYDFFARKFEASTGGESATVVAEAKSSPAVAASTADFVTLSALAQTPALDMLAALRPAASSTAVNSLSQAFLPRPSLVYDPIELMLLAQLDAPTRAGS